jgi:hypothetical protein
MQLPRLLTRQPYLFIIINTLLIIDTPPLPCLLTGNLIYFCHGMVILPRGPFCGDPTGTELPVYTAAELVAELAEP